jgi:Zn-dependent protease
MNLHAVVVVFDIIVFLFAISVHESAHAWMANRLGDPTARMLGRISLNPIRHIDLFGTILLPLIAAITGAPLLGWAKPTPVDTRNFKHLVRDDILTSLIGPVSNFIVAVGCFVLLGIIAKTSVTGHRVVHDIVSSGSLDTSTIITPFAGILYEGIFINVLLGIFNLIPLPPLDGSHVLRHFLPDGVRRMFDMAGIAILWILVLLRVPFLGPLLGPAMDIFRNNLMRL